jgi:hypothetical protein
MKKLFTLLAAATVALTMNAQEILNTSFEDADGFADGSLSTSWVGNQTKWIGSNLVTTTTDASSFWDHTWSTKDENLVRNHKTIMSGIAKTGTQSLSVKLNSDAAKLPSIDVKFRTGLNYTDGDYYKISCQVKIDAAGDATNAKVSANGNEWVPVTNTFQQIEQIDTVGSGGTSRLFFYFGNVETTTKYFVDDMVITKLTEQEVLDYIATDITSNKSQTFTVYPNPASDKINIIADGAVENIEIYNLAGVKVAEGNDVNHLTTGIYIVSATINGQVAIQKFNKK